MNKIYYTNFIIVHNKALQTQVDFNKITKIDFIKIRYHVRQIVSFLPNLYVVFS